MTDPGNWTAIASKVGDGHSRSYSQIRSVIRNLYAKLSKMDVVLLHPDAVDSLPDRFFEKLLGTWELMLIRPTFLETRIAILQRKLGILPEAQ
jgi:hypothetical protein